MYMTTMSGTALNSTTGNVATNADDDDDDNDEGEKKNIAEAESDRSLCLRGIE